ncbi:MAG TPA: VOC family protein [Candidatus Kryptonia bacterium]
MNGHIYFEIQADDLQRAANFYAKVFGWKFQRDPGIPIEYWRIQTGGTMGGLLKRPAKAPSLGSGTNAFVCSVEVENFDATARTIAKEGGKVALEKFAVTGVCWQGYFIDTEDNTFGVFQADSSAK